MANSGAEGRECRLQLTLPGQQHKKAFSHSRGCPMLGRSQAILHDDKDGEDPFQGHDLAGEAVVRQEGSYGAGVLGVSVSQLL